MKTKPIKEMSRGVINRPPFALRKFAGASAHCKYDQASIADFCHLFHQGAIPESLGNLQSLKQLVLSNNQLTGHFFTFWRWSVPTDHLNLADFLPPSAAGAIPESLGSLQSLVVLRLDQNQLTGYFFIFDLVGPH
jgi:Leucine-rich repeat (LRR) protein